MRFACHGLWVCKVGTTANGPLRRTVSADDQVKAYIKKIMSQLDRWMVGGKISRLVLVITDKDTGEHVERWQFDVQIFANPKSAKGSKAVASAAGQENAVPR